MADAPAKVDETEAPSTVFKQVQRATWILLAGVFIQLIASFGVLSAPSESSTRAKKEFELSRNLLLVSQGIEFALLASTVGLGAVLHWRCATESRWRRAALLVVAALVLSYAFLFMGIATLPESINFSQAQPLVSRIAFSIAEVVSLVQTWFIIVIASQVAVLCRSVTLLRQTEYLGYGYLPVACLSIAYVAWSLPDPLVQEDGLSTALRWMASTAMFILLLWMTQVLANVATVAGVSIDKPPSARKDGWDDPETE